MAIDPRLSTVISKIRKKHGDDAVVIGSEIHTPERPTITSGSLSIDAALGGGWAVNHWIEIVGHESSGKTFLVLKTSAANQKLDPNWTVVWFATADFVEDYASMCGVDLERVIVVDENTMEVVFEQCIEFLDTKAVDCIVIDSLPGLVPAREDENTMEDFQPGLGAFLTGKFFRKSNPSMKRSLVLDNEERPVTGFVVNQWREKIGSYGDPRTTPGGKAKNFFFFQRVDVKRTEWIRNTKNEPIGQTMEIKNIKNKYARPGRVGQVDAYVARGRGFEAGDFDVVKDIKSAALAYGVIGQSGSYFTYGEEKYKGHAGLEEALRTDGKLRASVRKATVKAAVAPLPIEEADEGSPQKSVAKPRKAVGKKAASPTTRRVGVRQKEA